MRYLGSCLSPGFKNNSINFFLILSGRMLLKLSISRISCLGCRVLDMQVGEVALGCAEDRDQEV